MVYTRFRSMLTQEPTAVRLLPLEVVEGEERPDEDEVLPLYEFEPSPAEVLDALLPRYVQSRIYFALLQAAASELAARQRAMKSATDNATELIKKYTRIANQARQAGITQEISEIVGGVNALADANAGARLTKKSERDDCHHRREHRPTRRPAPSAGSRGSSAPSSTSSSPWTRCRRSTTRSRSTSPSASETTRDHPRGRPAHR